MTTNAPTAAGRTQPRTEQPVLRFSGPPPSRRLAAGDLRLELTEQGDVRAIHHGGLLVSQYLAGPHDGAAGGLWLRRHCPDGVDVVPLVGVRSTARFAVTGGVAHWAGHVAGVAWTVTLAVVDDGWVWRVEADAPDRDHDDTPDGEVADAPSESWDLVVAQDLALAPASTALSSEPYVSQYLAHRAVDVPGLGRVLATRQTMACAPALPLVVMGITEGAAGHLTDGYDVWGVAARSDGLPHGLDTEPWRSRTTQYEFAMPTLVSERRPAVNRAVWHVVATVEGDVRGDLTEAGRAAAERMPAVVAAVAAAAPTGAVDALPDVPRSLLASAPLLSGEPLPEAELVALGGGDVLQPERDGSGALLSYFTRGATHVVSAAKELSVDRSHGLVLKAGDDVEPTDGVLSATVYAAGVFASHVVVGNTSANRLLSVHRNHLGLLRSAGVRLLVRDTPGTGGALPGRLDAWRLLAEPSALVMDLGSASWVYRHADLELVVTTTAAAHARAVELRVEANREVDLVLTADVELEGAFTAAPVLDGSGLLLRPARGTDLAAHYPDIAYVLATPDGVLGDDGVLLSDEGAVPLQATAQGSGLREPGPLVDLRTSVLTVHARATRTLRTVITGHLSDAAAAVDAAGEACSEPFDVAAERAGHRETIAALTRHLTVTSPGRLAELNALVPWFAQNALVHFLVPHGLEQYSGAAWGTRDVLQGPFELALAFDHPGTARDILLRVLAHQLPDGSLPQWFMFDAYQERYQDDSHGDVVVWPLFALAEYLNATGDVDVLDERVPFWDASGRRPGDEPVSVAEHVRATLAYVRAHRAPGTGLLSYGEGDWDDTLQPALASMREEMASAWTVALLHQAARVAAEQLTGTLHDELAAELRAEADLAATEFSARLVIDGVIAGYVVFSPDGPHPVIHPRDDRTGLHYRLIPMTQAITAGLLAPDLAARHEQLVADHLHYPDGVRLMDRPAPYADGVTRFFRRGEQGANVGREIGLMYTHAHVRYVESLASLGRDTVVEELLRISPIGQHERLSTSLPRQRNCYFSSSDADFPDRYTAAAQWDRLRADAADPVGVRGGWRVYSSGPGIYLRQVVDGALGLQVRAEGLVIDPTLAAADDGTEIELELLGRLRTVRYHVEAGDHPIEVQGDGRRLDGRPRRSGYRRDGVLLAADQLEGIDALDVYVGTHRSTLS